MNTLQSGFNDVPFRRVDHDRHAGNIRLRGNQIKEGDHGFLGIQHAFVHVHVDDLGTILHLLSGYRQGFVVIALENQALEYCGAGDITALADIDEQAVGADIERLKPRQAAGDWEFGQGARRDAFDGFSDRFDMSRCGATATADQIQKAPLSEIAKLVMHVGGGFIVLAELIGQARIEMAAEIAFRSFRKFFNKRSYLTESTTTVGANNQRLGMGNTVPEGTGRLAGQGTPAGVRKGHRNHDGQFNALIFEILQNRVDGGFGIQAVEDGFNQQQVYATVHQSAHGGIVILNQLVEGDVSGARIVYVRGDGCRPRGGADHPRHKTRLGGVLCSFCIRHLASEASAGQVQLFGNLAQLVIVLRHGGGIEGIGLDDIGTDIQKRLMNVADQIGAGEGEQVVIAAQIEVVVGKALAAVGGFLQFVFLNHAPHGPIYYQDAVF